MCTLDPAYAGISWSTAFTLLSQVSSNDGGATGDETPNFGHAVSWGSGRQHFQGDYNFYHHTSADTMEPLDPAQMDRAVAVWAGLYPIVTSQYSSTTSYQISYHIQ